MQAEEVEDTQNVGRLPIWSCPSAAGSGRCTGPAEVGEACGEAGRAGRDSSVGRADTNLPAMDARFPNEYTLFESAHVFRANTPFHNAGTSGGRGHPSSHARQGLNRTDRRQHRQTPPPTWTRKPYFHNFSSAHAGPWQTGTQTPTQTKRLTETPTLHPTSCTCRTVPAGTQRSVEPLQPHRHNIIHDRQGDRQTRQGDN